MLHGGLNKTGCHYPNVQNIDNDSQFYLPFIQLGFHYTRATLKYEVPRMI